MKGGRGLENVFQSVSKKRNLDRISVSEAVFSSSYKKSNSKQRLYRNLALAPPPPQHYSSVKFSCVGIVWNTVAIEARFCFALINGLFDETQMYDTNNIRLIWVNTRNSAV